MKLLRFEGVYGLGRLNMCAAGTHPCFLHGHAMLRHICANMLPALMHMPRFASCSRVPVFIVTHACLRRLRV
eukprot:2983137-Pleurochrysis_carterae.AAC.1